MTKSIIPFIERPLLKVGIFRKLLKRSLFENAALDVNNLLAKSGDIQKVSISDIEKILIKHKIKKQKRFFSMLQELYRDYLKYCLSDKLISDKEVSDLGHLKTIFFLNNKDIEIINQNEFEKAYKEAIEEVIKDGKIDEKEKEFLNKIQNNLMLSNDISKELYAISAQDLINKVVTSSLEDRRLSPQEENEMNEIAKNLGVELLISENTKRELDKFRLLWIIENGEIPEFPVDINLQKNEKSYFMTNVDWFEYRRVTKSVRYSGPTARFKITKGIYWRMGNVKVQRISDDILTKIDSGKVYLTNKRILFLGNRKNNVIQISKILSFSPYKNGIEIDKETGKSPFLGFEENVEIFTAMLGRVIDDLQK